MIVTRKHLPRRTFLRGVGAALALPMLDSMVPAFAAPGLNAKAPARLLFTYIPSGATMADWTPAGEGKDYQMSRILKPIAAFRDDFSVLGGLDHHQAEALGDGAGDHARAGAAYLTGVHCRKTGGTDLQAGISVDQITAKAIGSATRFPSLELGCDDTRTVGACDSGYSCAYQNTLSWRTPTSPIPPETNPRVVFERLFGTDDLSLSPADRDRRASERRSILDLVSEDTERLQGNLGRADRRKIDEYLYAVREVEKQIQAAEKEHPEFAASIEKPAGVPVLFADYLKVMFDLQIVAMQTDLTRVITFMYGREASQRTYGEIGIPDPHHPLTHHQGKRDWIEKVTTINVYHARNFAYFLNRLKSTQDGDGSLLDHCALVYGGGISEGNTHSKLNLPTLVAGRANGRLKPGRHIVYPQGTPMTNLFMTLLDTMDVHPESIGDSTGKLAHLTDI
jgi:Protein of unknown function (DUF1552)